VSPGLSMITLSYPNLHFLCIFFVW